MLIYAVMLAFQERSPKQNFMAMTFRIEYVYSIHSSTFDIFDSERQLNEQSITRFRKEKDPITKDERSVKLCRILVCAIWQFL